MSRLLHGIVPPLVTPLLNPATLDVPGLKRVIDRVLGGGVHGIFLLGSTGEFTGLTGEIRRAVTDEACSCIAGRVPVIVNVSDTCLAESLQLARHAAAAGAWALAICPPYYFPLDQSELTGYIRRFCEAVSLPVLLYNIPQFAHTPFEAETVAALSEVPNVAGLKNSNGSIEYLRSVRRRTAHRPEFPLLVGNEESLLSAMEAGADGGVCGGANVFPDLFVLLYEAAAEGRRAEAEALQTLVLRVSNDLYTIGPDTSSYLRGLKSALSVLGVCSDVMADPLEPFTEGEKRQLAERLERLLPFIDNSDLVRNERFLYE